MGRCQHISKQRTLRLNRARTARPIEVGLQQCLGPIVSGAHLTHLAPFLTDLPSFIMLFQSQLQTLNIKPRLSMLNECSSIPAQMLCLNLMGVCRFARFLLAPSKGTE